jgi:MYXO-CTERM domain-containing protein
MKFVCVLGAAALLGGISQAGVLSLDISGSAIDPLMLMDGQWNGGYGGRDIAGVGVDWGYLTRAAGSTADRMWVDEEWSRAGDVSLGFSMTIGEDATQFIGLNKRARNRSGFDWTAFDIQITTPGMGIVTVDEGTLSSAEFSSVTVLNNGTNVVTLKFSGGSVGYNQFANFTIDFEIPAGPSWTYTMTQTPVPTPGALALVGLGGLVAGRRRR